MVAMIYFTTLYATTFIVSLFSTDVVPNWTAQVEGWDGCATHGNCTWKQLFNSIFCISWKLTLRKTYYPILSAFIFWSGQHNIIFKKIEDDYCHYCRSIEILVFLITKYSYKYKGWLLLLGYDIYFLTLYNMILITCVNYCLVTDFYITYDISYEGVGLLLYGSSIYSRFYKLYNKLYMI